MRKPASLALAACALALAACAGGRPEASPRDAAAVPVVATTTMIADLVRHVGGPRVQVTGLLAPGGDPHLYKPVPSDAQAIANAKMVFVNGLKLEHWGPDLISRANPAVAVVEVTRGVKPRPSPFDPKVPDPHFWFDVRRWRQAVGNVEDGLVGLDPKHASTYHANAGLYRAELDALDGWVRARIQGVPRPRRTLITSHDAFAYFGESYGFAVWPIQGISTESEASTRDVIRVVEAVRKAKVPAVFVESSVNPKLVEQVARETGATLGGMLYSDSVGAVGTSGGDYVGMVRDNVDLIVEALK